MKLHKKLFGIVLLCVFLVGCAGKVDESKWSLVQDDMSIEGIEKSLGSPKKTITDKHEMLDEVNRKVNIAKDIVNSPVPHSSDLLEPINQTIEDLETVHYGIESDGDMKIIQYEVKGKNEDGKGYSSVRNIYLYGDRVVYYDGARH